MKRAVKNLIKDRDLGSYAFNNVKVEYRPSRPIGRCGDNAADEIEAQRLSPDTPSPVKRVSGWIVGEFVKGYAPITPHFWNIDTRTNTFYDTTERGYFKSSDQVEYVCDDLVDDLKTHNDAYCRVVYKSDNQAYLVGTGATVPMLSFTNKEIEFLQEAV